MQKQDRLSSSIMNACASAWLQCWLTEQKQLNTALSNIIPTNRACFDVIGRCNICCCTVTEHHAASIRLSQVVVSRRIVLQLWQSFRSSSNATLRWSRPHATCSWTTTNGNWTRVAFISQTLALVTCPVHHRMRIEYWFTRSLYVTGNCKVDWHEPWYNDDNDSGWGQPSAKPRCDNPWFTG